MTFTLPPLPYERTALEPHISKETLDYHYGKHHQAYVNKLNTILTDSPLKNQTLEEIIQETAKPGGDIFNNAAQVWNHTFYWHCLSPKGGQEPTGDLANAINKAFGSFEAFKEQFTKAAIATFGSGWAWLINTGGKLSITSTPNQDNPLMEGQKAVMGIDVWEHAYYLKYQNRRPDYITAWWNVVNWKEVEKRFSQS